MNDSADSAWGRKRTDATRVLIRTARRFTAQHGLAGFTIEELCAEASVSRRTFFNYFAGKEDAVLGLPLERTDAAAIEHFLAQHDSGHHGISPSLLIDLAVLNEARWRAMDIAPETLSDLSVAVEREPRLLARMIEHAIKEEQFDAGLIERRENLEPDDLRAQAAAGIVSAIARASTGDFFQPGNADSFTDIFERRIAAALDLFATQSSLIGPR